MSFRDLIKKLLSAGYQLSEDGYLYLKDNPNAEEIVNTIIKVKVNKPILSRLDLERAISEITTNNGKIEKANIYKEREEKSENKVLEKSKKYLEEDTERKKKKEKEIVKTKVSKREIIVSDYEIIFSPSESHSNGTATGFRKYFLSRYYSIQSIFKSRKDIENITTISDTTASKQSEVTIIAIVSSKNRTKKGTIILELEDPTGVITGIIPQNSEIIEKAMYILEDAVLCFTGFVKSGKFYIKEIKWPDVPYKHKPNCAYEDVFALFISDLHIGSKKFAGKLFGNLIKLVNGDLQSDKLNLLSRKIKYIFVAGDVVDGVGVYPGQIEDLAFDSINMQYFLAFELFEQLRSEVEIFIIPGNHDGARAAEPQTPILKDFCPELYSLPYVHMLGSPAYIKVHGVEVLMSHGNALIDIAAAIPTMRTVDSVKTMIETLKNRLLVPTYGKRTPIAPEYEDRLVIRRVPDIYQTGHTHMAADGEYKGITLINSGTLQFQTTYQKNMNIYPNTGLIYLVDLSTMKRTEIDLKKIG